LNLPDIHKSFAAFLKSDLISEASQTHKFEMEEQAAAGEEEQLDEEKAEKSKIKYPFPAFPYGVVLAEQSRNKWLNIIKDKPSDYWPLGDGWTYEKAFK